MPSTAVQVPKGKGEALQLARVGVVKSDDGVPLITPISIEGVSNVLVGVFHLVGQVGSGVLCAPLLLQFSSCCSLLPPRRSCRLHQQAAAAGSSAPVILFAALRLRERNREARRRRRAARASPARKPPAAPAQADKANKFFFPKAPKEIDASHAAYTKARA